MDHFVERRGMFAPLPGLDQGRYIVFQWVLRVYFQIVRSDAVDGFEIQAGFSCSAIAALEFPAFQLG